MSESTPELTISELSVFQALNEGLNGSQAAKKVFLSYNTVKSHTARVRRKLGVNSTAKAIGVLRDAGVLTANGLCVCRSASQSKSLVD